MGGGGDGPSRGRDWRDWDARWGARDTEGGEEQGPASVRTREAAQMLRLSSRRGTAAGGEHILVRARPENRKRGRRGRAWRCRVEHRRRAVEKRPRRHGASDARRLDMPRAGNGTGRIVAGS